jgi:hypothetical protein
MQAGFPFAFQNQPNTAAADDKPFIDDKAN